MKKVWSAPEAELILLCTESVMGPSSILDGGENGDGDVTELLPIDIFNNP